jgi:hypothetical protein
LEALNNPPVSIAEVRAALPDADIPALLSALVQITGDTSWLDSSALGRRGSTPFAGPQPLPEPEAEALLELASVRIRVNSIHPGRVLTPMVEGLGGDALAKRVLPLIPMGRLATVHEIAQLALFLASDDSSYCTGAEFVADGGVTAGVQFGAVAAATA